MLSVDLFKLLLEVKFFGGVTFLALMTGVGDFSVLFAIVSVSCKNFCSWLVFLLLKFAVNFLYPD